MPPPNSRWRSPTAACSPPPTRRTTSSCDPRTSPPSPRDHGGDRITEYGSAGFDTVYSSVSHTLGANVEKLRRIPGSGAVNVTGNGLDNELWATSERNTIRGVGGADRIDSGNGADTVIGGLGNDSFIYVSAVPSNPAARDTIQPCIQDRAEEFVTALGAAMATVYGDLLHMESVWNPYGLRMAGRSLGTNR